MVMQEFVSNVIRWYNSHFNHGNFFIRNTRRFTLKGKSVSLMSWEKGRDISVFFKEETNNPCGHGWLHAHMHRNDQDCGNLLVAVLETNLNLVIYLIPYCFCLLILAFFLLNINIMQHIIEAHWGYWDALLYFVTLCNFADLWLTGLSPC